MEMQVKIMSLLIKNLKQKIWLQVHLKEKKTKSCLQLYNFLVPVNDMS